MEKDELKEILELLKDTDITELQIEKDGAKVKIKREKFFSPIEVPKAGFQQTVQVQHEQRGVPAEEDDSQRLVTVTAPLVGTFYRAPSPEAPPFVEVGARVKKGQVICIIEAMKLMNEIESETDGVVVRELVENGHPVEYGEPLFLLEPV